MSNNDPYRLLSILILFYNQFKNVQLTTLIKDYIQVELTTAARLPSDLEYILDEAVTSGVQNEDALEDAVLKIEMYRKLFGVSSPQ